jgi:hypothetical protein
MSCAQERLGAVRAADLGFQMLQPGFSRKVPPSERVAESEAKGTIPPAVLARADEVSSSAP